VKSFTAPPRSPPYHHPVSASHFLRKFFMTITDFVLGRSHSTVRDHDAWIIFGYAVLSIVAIAAIYLAAGGPGASEADIASAVIVS
jgi:hypothetical protein